MINLIFNRRENGKTSVEISPVKYFTFSGGEVQASIDAYKVRQNAQNSIVIDAALYNSNDIMALFMTVDAIRHINPIIPLALRMKYLPYARQDRVMNPGEALALKVFCNMINALNFTEVEVWDVHSDVSLALLDRVKAVTVDQLVRVVPILTPNTILVAPDAGANKKVGNVAKSFGNQMVRADKVRSVKDGSITGTVVYTDHVGDKDFLIIDDICDGGRTFTELAKELKQKTNGKVYLYVTHGIFSKGLDVFNGLIDKVFVAVPFPDVDLKNPIVYQLVNVDQYSKEYFNA